MRSKAKRLRPIILWAVCAAAWISGCTATDDPEPPPPTTPDARAVDPVHRLDGLTLLTTPKSADPGRMMGIVAGELLVNDKGCFSIGSHVLVTDYEASILPDGEGISIPGIGKIMIGDRVRGGGGYVERYKEPGAEACRGSATEGFAALRALGR